MLNASRLNELQTAGIPMRKGLTSFILLWKMMLFHGQNVVEFSGANYSANAWRPGSKTASDTHAPQEARDGSRWIEAGFEPGAGSD